MNHCPVYQNVGGHSYGWVYPGPIGSILTPMYVGLENALDLPQASTLCNQCGVVCPVKIPLPDLQRKLREREFAEDLRPWTERAGLTAVGWFAQRPALYAFASRIGVRVLRMLGGRRRHDPQPAVRCAAGRTGATCRRRRAARSASSIRERAQHDRAKSTSAGSNR